jgi:hypothetical protein
MARIIPKSNGGRTLTEACRMGFAALNPSYRSRENGAVERTRTSTSCPTSTSS